MKSKRYMLVILSIFLILLVFVSSASAADANGTEVLSVDESANTINEKLALDYSLDNPASNDTNVVENEEILQNQMKKFYKIRILIPGMLTHPQLVEMEKHVKMHSKH